MAKSCEIVILLYMIPEENMTIKDISKYYEHVWDLLHAPNYLNGCGMFAKFLKVPSPSCIKGLWPGNVTSKHLDLATKYEHFKDNYGDWTGHKPLSKIDVMIQ